MRLELIICPLNAKLCRSIIRSWVEFSLSQVLQLMQQVCSSLSIDIISRSNTRIRRISPNILSQGNIDNVLNSESISSLEIDLPGFEVILDELKKGIEFKRQSFLNIILDVTCDFERRIYSRESPVFSSSSNFFVISWLILIRSILPWLFHQG